MNCLHVTKGIGAKRFGMLAFAWGALAHGAMASDPAHLVSAEQLVKEIVTEGNNGIFKINGTAVNRYGGTSAINYVTWTPYGTCYARCSSFLSMLLKASYPGWTPKGAGFTSTSPTAAMYHDAISSNSFGFKNVPTSENLHPGDLLVAKYLDGSGDTGHVMMVESWSVSLPDSNNVKTWQIQVIDCADSGHTNDTRAFQTAIGTVNTTGVGAGLMHVFTVNGQITGYSWSTSKYSKVYTPAQRHLVLGRFTLGG